MQCLFPGEETVRWFLFWREVRDSDAPIPLVRSLSIHESAIPPPSTASEEMNFRRFENFEKRK